MVTRTFGPIRVRCQCVFIPFVCLSIPAHYSPLPSFRVQTVSDVREAYRNVTGIVRETINEAARPPTSTAATADGDQMMMAAGNAVENEISSGTTAAAPPVDERVAGTTLGKLLGRNYRGLRRLFNSELRSALKVRKS